MVQLKNIGAALMMLMLPAAQNLFAQSSPGEIQGKVLENKTTGAYALIVSVETSGGPVRSQTDEEGRYTLKPLDPGTYIMSIIRDLDTFKFETVVNSNEITRMKDVDLSKSEYASEKLKEFEVVAWVDPLIRVDQASMEIVRAKELVHSPAKRDIKKIIGTVGGVQVNDAGDAYVRGSRADAIIYYVDGVKLMDNFRSPPSSAIASVAVYTGGVPAKYGDCTSGVVVVETKNYFSLYNEWKAQQAQKGE